MEDPLGPGLEVREERIDARTRVIGVRGEIHLSTAPEFSDRVTAAIDAGTTTLVLDLSEVAFIDSTGLTVLLNALRRIGQARGHLAIACANPTVLRLFEITALDTTFEIFGDRAAALTHVQAAGEAANSDGAP